MTASRPESGPRRAPALDALWAATAVISAAPLLVDIVTGDGLAPWERTLAAALMAFAAWRPLEALTVLAAVGPLARAFVAGHGSSPSPLSWALPAVLTGTALAVGAGRVSQGRGRTAGVAASLLLAWVALASVAVLVCRDTMLFETGDAWRKAAASFASEQHFTGTSPWRAAAAGVWLAQCALIVPVVMALVAAGADAGMPVRLALAGATGAGALNIIAAVNAGLRADAWRAFLKAVTSSRFAAAFPDVNSLGSLLALAIPPTVVAFVLAARARRRTSAAAWGTALCLQLSGLWLAGSRVSLAAIPVAGLAAQATSAWRGGMTRRRLAVLAAIVAGGVVVLGASQVRRIRNDAPLALRIRVEFVKTTLAMLRDHPVWGVGAGGYPKASSRYSSAQLRAYYPAENAHNNFLQVAGELGPAGLLPFLALVGIPLVSIGRLLARGEAGSHTAGLWTGILAFLLTCTGGHPLLLPDVSAPFFVLLGVLWGLAALADRSPAPPSRRTSWTLGACALVLAVSVPWRAAAERGAADLEHIVVTGERWVRHDGVPTLRFRGHVAVYVVSDAGTSRVTVRAADDRRGPIEVTFRLDGRVVNMLRLSDRDWKTVPMQIPTERGSRFRLLRIEATRPTMPGTDPVVLLRRIDHEPPGTPLRPGR